MSQRHSEKSNCTKPAQVLVLDDESYIRGLLARWLTEAGYVCVEARDNAEAWERLQPQDIDLVTLDVRMPGESGLDLVHRIKHEFPDIAILMVTAVDVAMQAVTALTRGACGYLIKPVDRENFLFHVRKALAEQQRKLDDREVLQRLKNRVREQDKTLPDRPHMPMLTRPETSTVRSA